MGMARRHAKKVYRHRTSIWYQGSRISDNMGADGMLAAYPFMREPNPFSALPLDRHDPDDEPELDDDLVEDALSFLRDIQETHNTR